ncbi:MAG: class I SAM-dependent methyltransferase [Cardiobacteriaceae bacterium]|nr:class I SAM-dependent methyltransferase [Cardiobacteriaceae bacterium]
MSHSIDFTANFYGDPALLPIGFQLLTSPPEQDFYLTYEHGGYILREGAKRFGELSIDFHEAYYRARGGTEYLPKALKGLKMMSVLDVTAGWGRDSWLLAYRGFQVTMVERNPYLGFLLQQAVQTAQASNSIGTVAARLSFIATDALTYLNEYLAKRFDNLLWGAIYLDPMYPERKKQAMVKKPMQVLQALLGEAGDGEDLLACARLAIAAGLCERVVVKRPQTAPHLSVDKPDYSIDAPNTRFDVYRN